MPARLPAGIDAPSEGWLAALARRLEAEQERWFLWFPVMLGIGIGIYFSLDTEPHLLTALSVGAVGIGVRALVVPRRTLGLLLGSALMAMTVGFALAKVRVEAVRAPVLVKQMRVEVRGFIELIEPRAPRGDRLTLRVTKIGDMAPEARPVRVRITSTGATSGLAAGDAVVLWATLMPPAGPANMILAARRGLSSWAPSATRAPPSSATPKLRLRRATLLCGAPSAGFVARLARASWRCYRARPERSRMR